MNKGAENLDSYTCYYKYSKRVFAPNPLKT